MPDSKITALASTGTGTDPANDPLVIVDVSDTSMAATGTTKKVTLNNLLACSPTATLASATITGDLTAARLIVTGGTIPTNGLWLATTNTLEFAANSLAQYRIAPLGVFSWYDGAGGTRMTLNATGLGIGVSSPSFKLHVQENASNVIARFTGSNTNGSVIDIINTGTGGGSYKIGSNYTIGGAGEFAIYDATAAATRLLISSTGNVGIGVTPLYKFHAAVTSGAVGAFRATTAAIARLLVGNTVEDVELKVNANGDGQLTAGASKYLSLGSGGINDRVILDTSGNLLVNVPTTAPTLATNSQMVFNLTSNTNLRISVRGTDGTTRTANITLA